MNAGLTLAQVAREVPGEVSIVGDEDVVVTGVRHDSREVVPGDAFVARKGAHADGARFVRDAKARGAVAVIAAAGTVDAEEVGLPVMLVGDVADGLAFASAAVYGHPAFSLEVVGITGTNGKTTTAHLVRAAVDAALGVPSCGILGTVGHAFGGKTREATHTTPEADELARVLAWMRTEGATHVAMEVSSHALDLGRVRAVRFRVAALTNLTQDHLDFHGSMEKYAASKRTLTSPAGVRNAAAIPPASIVTVRGAMSASLSTAVLTRTSGAFAAFTRSRPNGSPTLSTHDPGAHVVKSARFDAAYLSIDP